MNLPLYWDWDGIAHRARHKEKGKGLKENWPNIFFPSFFNYKLLTINDFLLLRNFPGRKRIVILTA
jgi:hypothetical protein